MLTLYLTRLPVAKRSTEAHSITCSHSPLDKPSPSISDIENTYSNDKYLVDPDLDYLHQVSEEKQSQQEAMQIQAKLDGTCQSQGAIASEESEVELQTSNSNSGAIGESSPEMAAAGSDVSHQMQEILNMDEDDMSERSDSLLVSEMNPKYQKAYAEIESRWEKKHDGILQGLAVSLKLQWKKIFKKFKQQTGLKRITLAFMKERYKIVKTKYEKKFVQMTKKDDDRILELYLIYGEDWIRISAEMDNVDPIKIRNRFFSKVYPRILDSQEGLI